MRKCLLVLHVMSQHISPLVWGLPRGTQWWRICLPAKWETLGWEDPPKVRNGKPLQNSCLRDPMDRGVGQATVHGVAKSRTQLKWLNSNSSESHFQKIQHCRSHHCRQQFLRVFSGLPQTTLGFGLSCQGERRSLFSAKLWEVESQIGSLHHLPSFLAFCFSQ